MGQVVSAFNLKKIARLVTETIREPKTERVVFVTFGSNFKLAIKLSDYRFFFLPLAREGLSLSPLIERNGKVNAPKK